MAGDDAVQFGLGEPDFQPPIEAINAFHQAMLDGHNKYTTTAGLPALRKKIAESWHHLSPDLDENNVCMTMSGTNALLNIFASLVDPGKNVLLPEPYFPLYGPDATLVGGSASPPVALALSSSAVMRRRALSSHSSGRCGSRLRPWLGGPSPLSTSRTSMGGSSACSPLASTDLPVPRPPAIITPPRPGSTAASSTRA